MKRRLLLSILLLPVLLYATAYDGTDDQLQGMGVSGIALGGGYGGMFANPATLTGGAGTFSLMSRFNDSYEAGRTVINTPSSSVLASFRGNNLAFTMEMHNVMDERQTVSDGDQYKATAYTRLQLDWGYSFSRFSVGLSFKTTTSMQLSPATINNGQRISDYIVQAFFERYEQVYGATSLTAGFGLYYDNDWLTIGIVSNQFALATTDGTISFSFMDLYRSFGAGFALSTPTYAPDSQLHLIKATFSAELLNAGDPDEAQTRAGLDLTFQLLPEYQVSLRTGYHDTKDGNGVQNLNLQTAYNSFGVGVRLGDFRLNLSTDIPITLYLGEEVSSIPFSLVFGYVK